MIQVPYAAPPDGPAARAARIAARQWGVVDNQELWACGLSRDSVMRRRRSGQLHLVYPGVYLWGHNGLTLQARCLAAVKACGPGAVPSHRSAAALWRLIEWDEDQPLDVSIPMRGARRIPGITIHRTRVPMEVVRLDAIPVTIALRALLDLSSVYSFHPLRRAARQALALKRVTVKDLVATRGRRGGATLTKILADGYVPTRSELEDAVLDLILSGGFVRPDVNSTMMCGGRPTVPDFRWPEKRLVVEADSRTWHDDPLARKDDAERQARLEAAGERVLRITWRQTMARPAETIGRLKAAGAPVSA